MKQGNMLAMILAGGRGSRLHELTSKVAKPLSHMAESTALSTSRSVTARTVASTLWVF